MDLHDVAAEQRLIGILMRRPKLWGEIADRCKGPVFFGESTRRIIALMHEETPPGRDLVPSRVLRRLGKEDHAEIKRLAEMSDSVVSMDEVHGIVDMLRDLAARRTILHAMTVKQADLYDLGVPLHELLGEIQSAMLQAVESHGHDGTKTWEEVLQQNYLDMIGRRDGQVEPAWPVGLNELSRILKGIRRKHLIVVSGRPSMGKTTFAQFWVVHLARRGVHGYVFCPDQAAEEIGERELWNVSHIDGTRWERADEWSDGEFERAKEAFSKLYKLPIKINDRRGMGPDEICAVARREKAANPDLGVIVIDHLSALSLRGDRRLNWSKVVGEATKTFKNLAEELDVAVVLLSQLNRSLEARQDKRPTMSDLRDSGEIEEHANEILFLYREEYYKPDMYGVRNVCEIHVAKQKQGPRGETAFVKFEPEYARFSDLSVAELNAYVNSIEAERSKRSGAA